jgi:Ca2+-binding EF-hand superfamily protein
MKPIDARFFLVAFASVLACSGCLRAVAGGEARGERLAAEARERFAAADADEDGLLTREEAAHGMPRVAGHFDEIDATHAGKVSLEQILRYAAGHRRRGDGG